MIGHASKDENGKSVGGRSGDQTTKEVCVRSWYNSGWHTVLRPKDKTLAERAAVACEAACANDNIGYDQNQRNTLNAKAKEVGYDIAKIDTPCECDCSALMHVCAIAGGANLNYGSNGVTTRTMVDVFMQSGNYEKLTESKYLTSDKYLRRGDVLVKNGHTAMCLTDGEKVTEELPKNKVKKLIVDGKWGKTTTTRLQQIFGTTVDGEVSNQWMDYKASNPGLTNGWEWQEKPNGKGSSLIKAMQKWAGMDDCDGEIGPKTIRAFQRKLGTAEDGKVSKPSQMVKALQRWANEQ